VIVVGPLVLTGAGIALTFLHGGPVFAKQARIHKWTTYMVTPFIVGHMLIAFSVPPGYRGVWRSIHLGGRVPKATARRVWPGWAERSLRTVHQGTPWTDRRVSRTVADNTERITSRSDWPASCLPVWKAFPPRRSCAEVLRAGRRQVSIRAEKQRGRCPGTAPQDHRPDGQ
jgi:hypothetical protein